MSKIDPFWVTVDEFTLTQAACLWLDCEPCSSRQQLEPLQKAAAQLITKHTYVVHEPYYVLDPNGNSCQPTGKIRVTRAELLALAEKKGYRPFFLFSEPEKDLKPNERSALLKMVLGMAMDKYGYRPNERNEATGEGPNSIKASLDQHGLRISNDTILRYLTEAPKDLD